MWSLLPSSYPPSSGISSLKSTKQTVNTPYLPNVPKINYSYPKRYVNVPHGSQFWPSRNKRHYSAPAEQILVAHAKEGHHYPGSSMPSLSNTKTLTPITCWSSPTSTHTTPPLVSHCYWFHHWLTQILTATPPFLHWPILQGLSPHSSTQVTYRSGDGWAPL